jgi:sugar lactone lactonase YvrE
MRLPAPVSVLIVATLLAAPASSGPPPSSIPLPVDFQPEGIAQGDGTTFFVGSLRDGDVYRGDLRTGAGAVLVDNTDRVAVGMRVDRERGWLFVAGGATGHIYVYSTTDGSQVADVAVGPAGSTFTNDVALAAGSAYFTDTFAPTLYKVTYGDGSWAASTITVTGPAGTSIPNTFGLNGIDATPDGSMLIVNHTQLGIVATVDPASGASQEISLSGGGLIPGTPDGLQLEGHTLWVVENFANSIAKIRLAPDLASGRVVETVTSPLFRVPTTVVKSGSRLAAVNGRFDLGFPPPFGPGAPPGTDFDVVQIRP